MNEAELIAEGKALVELLELKPKRETRNGSDKTKRFDTAFGDKTYMGLALSVRRAQEESKAPEGQVWVQNLMSGNVVLEDKDLPFSCSVTSEAYFSS